MTLTAFSKHHVPLVSAEIQAFFDERKRTAADISPAFLHSVETLDNFVTRGGKNIRSLLVIGAYQLAGGKNSDVYKVAAGVELFHKHLLALDDIADRDETRYGGPTLWRQYQQEFADRGWSNAEHHGRTFAEIDITMLFGPFAFDMVRSAKHFSPETLLTVMDVMRERMYWKTMGGWQIQYLQNHEPLATASEEQFMKGLELVTAQYTFVAPLNIGLILAGKTELMKPLEAYALNVGRAFQIYDDILGLFGEPDEMGKPVGNDVREGKKTLLLQRAFRAANETDQKFLADVCGRDLSVEELERVRTVVKETGSLAYSQNLAHQSIADGISALQSLQQSPEVVMLKDLAEFVIARSK